jgi:SP family general alpha glucoside:H+ symporter-like MFS transporter
MISPDAAHLGVVAIYLWAGLLVPTIVILNFFYSEARSFASYFIALAHVPQTYGRTYIELDALYERKSPAWKFRTTETVSDQVKNKAPVSSHHKSGANEA